MKQKVYVTASEIGEYVYCPRGWWLRLNGFIAGISERMIEGTKQHESVARSLRRNQILIIIAMKLIFVGILSLIILFSSQWIFSIK